MLYFLLAYALTLPAALLEAYAAGSSDLLAWLKLACLAAFGWHATTFHGRQRAGAASGAALALAIGCVWAAVLAIHLYKVVTMMPFTFSMAISSIEDTRRTLVRTLGAHGVLYVALLLGFVVALAAATAWLALRMTGRLASHVPRRRAATVLCLGLVAYLAAADAKYIVEELVLYPRDRVAQFPFRRVDYAALAPKSGESVFIIQLESVSAHALFERSPDGRSVRRRIRLPGIETMLEEGGGVFYPFFYANTTQTHRAQEAILCGISGNIGPALSLEPERLVRHTCLPRHLLEHGYATVFLYSYFDLDFYNFGAFHRQAGFTEAAYGKGLMRAGDPRHQWGYDDCAFYGRAFDYLERRGLAKRERLFAYFEVGANHWPYHATRKHPEAHPFPAPKRALEHYLNSVAEQDYCLLRFWERLKRLDRNDIHVLVIPDHSVMVDGLSEELEPMFQTWFAYVPPVSRRSDFRPREVLDLVPSQAQIYATVLELLGAPRTRDSFAFSLRGQPRPPSYADCHLLAGASSLVRVRDGKKAEWNLGLRTLQRAGGEPQPMDFKTFHQRHYCP